MRINTIHEFLAKRRLTGWLFFMGKPVIERRKRAPVHGLLPQIRGKEKALPAVML
jgi:hypothetical protein